MIRAGDDHQLLFCNDLRYHAGMAAARITQAQRGLAPLHQVADLLTGRGPQFQTHFGVLFSELPQRVCQGSVGECPDQCQRNSAGFALTPGAQRFRAICRRGKHDLRIGKKSRAGIGEDTAAAQAFEQRDVEFALQQFDASADGGLRAVQRSRRTTEAAPAGYSHERPDLVHVHE
jgi:hypothetical protein